jgi:peptidoglycan/LPS O-acetylase OafA/YrhL
VRAPGQRVASLDGLRALSVILVLFGHIAGTAGFPLGADAARLFDLGNLGVRVFFVISGFLITKLLLEELTRTGRIDVPRFFLRRTLRLSPPYGVFLAALVILYVVGAIAFTRADFLHAATYTSNYYAIRSWNVAHTWSLAVEEQFYLLWPLVLLLAGRRAAMAGVALFVLAAPLIRAGTWMLFPGLREGIGHRFETVADAIAVGCLVAGMETWLLRQSHYRALLRSPAFVLVPVAVVCLTLLYARPSVADAAISLINVGIALCLHRVVLYPKDRIGRLLNSRPAVFIGAISYSLYLWQQIFLNKASGATFTTFPLNLTLAIAAALASYYLVERPALRWRQRLEARLWAPAPAPELGIDHGPVSAIEPRPVGGPRMLV